MPPATRGRAGRPAHPRPAPPRPARPGWLSPPGGEAARPRLSTPPPSRGDGAGTGRCLSAPFLPCCRCRRSPRPVRAGSPGPGKSSGSSAGAPGVFAARPEEGVVRAVSCRAGGSLSEGGKKGRSGPGPQPPAGPRWGQGRPTPARRRRLLRAGGE